MKISTIIIEDEPKAIQLLKGYLEHYTQIDLLGSFRNGLKALDFIRNHNVDLIFLDINMPHLSGLDLSKLIDTKQSQVIFTTAYSEYAVQSYEVNALDYLLKPISFERFALAMQKLLSQQDSIGPHSQDTIKIKCGSNFYKVNTNEISFLKKDGNYMYYHMANERLMSRQSIQDALDQLPSYFIQIHKSIIINLKQVAIFNRHEVQIDESTLPIGNSYKEHTLRRLQEL